MTPQQFAQYLALQQQQIIELSRIAAALEQLQSGSSATGHYAPNYERNLNEFSEFDWSSIGAVVEYSDDYGVAAVRWGGKSFRRRSANNKFTPAIWFSRCCGKDERGENVYERLVTFKPIAQAEPLPERVKLAAAART